MTICNIQPTQMLYICMWTCFNRLELNSIDSANLLVSELQALYTDKASEMLVEVRSNKTVK